MIPDEEEYPEQTIFACFYCKDVIGVSDSNSHPMILSCTNHSDITIYHHYEGYNIEPRNLSILYDFEDNRYDIFISISNLNFMPKDNMEIGYFSKDDPKGRYVPLHRRPIPPNFVPEQIPALIKQIASLKVFL